MLHWCEYCSCFSDKLSRACKIRDEYGLVKDLVREREQKRFAVATVTAPYADGSGARKGIFSSVKLFLFLCCMISVVNLGFSHHSLYMHIVYCSTDRKVTSHNTLITIHRHELLIFSLLMKHAVFCSEIPSLFCVMSCTDHYGADVHVLGSHPYPNGPGN